MPPLPGGNVLDFSGNCLELLSDWAKSEIEPPLRLTVASGFNFAFGALRTLTPLCPIFSPMREWCRLFCVLPALGGEHVFALPLIIALAS
jgi:hypothetical protein